MGVKKMQQTGLAPPALKIITQFEKSYNIWTHKLIQPTNGRIEATISIEESLEK